MPIDQLKTPVVLIIFNRPAVTAKVFEAVRLMRPERMFVVADGPRGDRPCEDQLCLQARQAVELVDWPCRVEKNFSDVNLGCMRRVSSGLDWVFSQVDQAIILEDDCLPHPSFFPFCEELLQRYRDEPRIAQISGVNFQFGHNRTNRSYYFSRFSHSWGWATWKRAWQLRDMSLAEWPCWREQGRLAEVLPGKPEVVYWTELLDKVVSGEIDSWACRWAFTCWAHGMLTVLPSVNLISNIGFGPMATHTTGASRFAAIPGEELSFPLSHPENIESNHDADRYTACHMYRKPTFLRKIGMLIGGRLQ